MRRKNIRHSEIDPLNFQDFSINFISCLQKFFVFRTSIYSYYTNEMTELSKLGIWSREIRLFTKLRIFVWITKILIRVEEFFY